MKLCFLFLALFAAFAKAADSTVVTEFCGMIDLPVTWKKEHSPYRITGDIQISLAARLTIEAGVEVHIVPGETCGETKQLDWADSNYISIKAYGPLVISGTAAEPVKILPEKHVPGKIQWDGIRMPLKDRASVIIEYLHIMGAHKAINASFSRFNVGNSLFIDNSTGIWLENEGDISVYNCVFTKNLSAGIYISNSRPSIAANIFHKNSNFGIWSDSRPSPRIQNNIFFENADTDCRFCPVGVSKIITKKEDPVPKDKFENIYTDPIFSNSEKEKLMAKKDPNLPTPAKEIKDPDLQKIYKEAKNIPSPAKIIANPLPYSLSVYSPGLNAAPKTSFFKDLNGKYDIGLYGGGPNRNNITINF
jgi:parallel beta-helix repeat protein